MLDDNLPTFRLQPCPDDARQTLVFFSRNGAEPVAAYLLRRPAPADAPGQYALGLLDAQLPALVYAEVGVRPEWTTPTLSAAEVRAASHGSHGGHGSHNGHQQSSTPPPHQSAPVTPMMPDSFAVNLYDPDVAVSVRHRPAAWNKSDAWEFELAERSFRLPSASRIDRDNDPAQPAALAPRLVFRWKRDSRLTKDMTCYMSGRSVAGRKSKEPDITVAMFRAAKHDGAVTIYEPNMARVDIEDRKGLELSLILAAVVIRDLYLAPRHDPFNMAAAAAAGLDPSKLDHQTRTGKGAAAPHSTVFASGALGSPAPLPASGAGRDDTRLQADAAVEAKRLQALAIQETRKAREREKRDAEEQKRIKKMLDDEDKERRRREAAVERETERLRKEYGVPGPASAHRSSSPALPPRTGQSHMPARHSGRW